MNKERRKRVSVIKDELQSLIDQLDEVRSDEEYAFDSMPESLQGSIRGDESQEAIEAIDGAIDSLNEAIDSLDEII